jgi:hypothetical protein
MTLEKISVASFDHYGQTGRHFWEEKHFNKFTSFFFFSEKGQQKIAIKLAKNNSKIITNIFIFQLFLHLVG